MQKRSTFGVNARLVAVALLLLACRSEAERKRTLAALTVSSAIQAVRQAPHDDKAPALEQLRASPCAEPQSCEVKEVCVQAYALHQRSVETTENLRRELDRTAAPPAGVAELLAATERDLDAAKRLIDECLRLESVMLVEARP